MVDSPGERWSRAAADLAAAADPSCSRWGTDHESIGHGYADIAGTDSGSVVIQIAADLSVALGVGVVVGFAFRGGVPDRRPAVLLVAGLVAFGLFAGGVDVPARFGPVPEGRAARGVFGLVEEGGGMVVVSFLAWFSLMIRRDFVSGGGS